MQEEERIGKEERLREDGWIRKARSDVGLRVRWWTDRRKAEQGKDSKKWKKG